MSITSKKMTMYLLARGAFGKKFVGSKRATTKVPMDGISCTSRGSALLLFDTRERAKECIARHSSGYEGCEIVPIEVRLPPVPRKRKVQS